MKNFVVVVDTQYDFMLPDGILYVDRAEEIIVPINQYLGDLDPDTTAGVLFTFDTHVKERYEGSPESEMFPLHCELGTKGHRNVINPDIIHEKIPVYDLQKEVFDMWSSREPVMFAMNSAAPSIDNFFFFNHEFHGCTIDIIGVALNFCVKQAVDGFLERGFKVRLHSTMTRGIDTGKPGDLDARLLYAEEIVAGRVEVIGH